MPQIDTRHLSQNHRTHIKNGSLITSEHDKGVTKRYKVKKLSEFAIDLSMTLKISICYVHHSLLFVWERVTTIDFFKVNVYPIFQTDGENYKLILNSQKVELVKKTGV